MGWQKILFVAGYTAEFLGIATIDSSGTLLDRIVNHPDGNLRDGPVWSSDGSKIAFYNDVKEGRGIWIVNSDGTGLHKFIDSIYYPSHPAFAHHSQQIVFSDINPEETKKTLWLINLDGTGRKQLTF
ncbi:MAG: hypothetical protein QMD71_08365 [bacterium]|nr:hypothetical protein [bacterium]